MAIWRYDFSINRPNPALGLQAAGLGERMRANRALEAQRDREYQRQTQQDTLAATQRSREEQRAALTDYTVGINAVSQIEDPTMRADAYRRMRARLGQVHGADAIASLPPDLDERMMASHLAELAPYAQQLKDTRPASVREAEWYKGASEEDRAAFDAAQRAGAPQGATNLPAPVVRELEDGSLVAFSIDPNTLQTRQTVLSPAPPPEDPEAAAAAAAEAAAQQTRATETAKTEARETAGEERLAEVWKQYRDAVDKAPRAFGIVKDANARKNLEGLRRRLYTAIAKTVLGTPGAEPSPELYRRADEMTPGWEGTALIGFEGAMDSLLREETLNSLRGQGGGRQAGQIPTVTNREEYNALPSGTEFTDPDGNVRRKP